MKLVQSLFVAALVAVPALSFAQSSEPLTRADVRAELSSSRRPATTRQATTRSTRRTSRPR